LDAGANEGYVSLALARQVGENGRVIAIEPHPRNAAVMRENSEINAFGNIILVQRAVGDSPGSATFEGDRAWWTLLPGLKIPGGSITVTVTRIDDVVAEQGLQRLDLIKLDLEGFEIAALLGAKESLRRFRPIVGFEVNLTLLAYVPTSINVLFQLFRELDYEIREAADGELRPFTWLHSRIMNVVGVPREKTSIVTTRK